MHDKQAYGCTVPTLNLVVRWAQLAPGALTLKTFLSILVICKMLKAYNPLRGLNIVELKDRQV